MSRMEANRAVSSSCSCFSNTSRRMKQGGAERRNQSSDSDHSGLTKSEMSLFSPHLCRTRQRRRSGWSSAPSAAGSPERQSPRGRAAKRQNFHSQPTESHLQLGSRPKHHNHVTEMPPRSPPPPQLLLERQHFQPEIVRLEEKGQNTEVFLPFRGRVMPCSVIWRKTKRLKRSSEKPLSSITNGYRPMTVIS